MKPIKHEWIKYYLIVALIIGALVLLNLVQKLNWLYLHPIDNIMGVLLIFFIVSYPHVMFIYAFAKQKRNSITALAFITGLQWLVFTLGAFLLFTSPYLD